MASVFTSHLLCVLRQSCPVRKFLCSWADAYFSFPQIIRLLVVAGASPSALNRCALRAQCMCSKSLALIVLLPPFLLQGL